jgi:hypothetical protein
VRVLLGLLAHEEVLLQLGIGLLQIAVSALQVGAQDIEGIRDLVEFVGAVLGPPVQAQRRRRPRQIVASRKSGNGDEVAGDEEVKNVEDKERDEKRLGGLACEDESCSADCGRLR